MKKTLIASALLLISASSLALAGMPSLNIDATIKAQSAADTLQLVRNGSDDNGGDDRGGDRDRSSSDDNGGDDRGGDRDRSSNDDHDDDHGDRGRGRGRGRGGDRDRSGDDSVAGGGSTDDSPVSGSNRRKVRVPGGSGCDDPGDIFEHAACQQ